MLKRMRPIITILLCVSVLLSSTLPAFAEGAEIQKQTTKTQVESLDQEQNEDKSGASKEDALKEKTVDWGSEEKEDPENTPPNDFEKQPKEDENILPDGSEDTSFEDEITKEELPQDTEVPPLIEAEDSGEDTEVGENALDEKENSEKKPAEKKQNKSSNMESQTADKSYFTLVVQTSDEVVVLPDPIFYSGEDSVYEALVKSGHDFDGIDTGFITSINGVTPETYFLRWDDSGDFDLEKPASKVKVFQFYEPVGSEGEKIFTEYVQLYQQMARYTLSSAAQEDFAATTNYEEAVTALLELSPFRAMDLTRRLTVTIDAAEENFEPEEPEESTGRLKSLEIRQSGFGENSLVMEPAFSSDVFEYTVSMPDYYSWAWVSATVADASEESTVTAEWTDTKGEEKSLDLVSGATVVALRDIMATAGEEGFCKIIVTDESGDTEYTVRFPRERSLKGFTATADNKELQYTPKFNRETLRYSVLMGASVPELTLSLEPYGTTEDGYITLLDGTEVEGTGAVALTGGAQEITLGVSHRDGTGENYILEVEKTEESVLTFRTNPEQTAIMVFDSNGQRLLPNDEGEYILLQNENYFYQGAAKGYVGTKGEITPTKPEEEVQITLEKAKENTTIQPDIPSSWPNFRGTRNNNAIVSAPTPTSLQDATLYWATKQGAGWGNAPSSVIIVDEHIIFTTGTSINKMNKETGEVVASSKMVAASAFNITPPTYADGIIFVGLSKGRIQAFNADTLESLWLYEDPLGGQPNSPLIYHNGYVYTGFWNSEVRDANYVCLSATDEDPDNPLEEKLALWTHTQKGGFYWAGAYVTDNYLLVGSDDGSAEGDYIAEAKLFSFHPETGEIIDRYDEIKGDARSSICYDEVTDTYYFTTKGGTFYRFQVGEDGTFDHDALATETIDLGGMSTSTPVVHNGRAYVGVSGAGQFGAYNGHNITVIDLASWNIAYKAPTKGYPQTSGLLTTAYDDFGYAYVYMIDNYTPGMVRYLKDRPGLIEMEEYSWDQDHRGETIKVAPVLFTPKGSQAQYAISSPIADENGTIYFKNDSGYVMSVGSRIESLKVTEFPDKLTYVEGESFDPQGLEVSLVLANGMTRPVTQYIEYTEDAFTKEDGQIVFSYSHVMYNDEGEINPPTVALPIAVLSAEENKRVQDVIALIERVDTPDITLAHESQILGARAAYESLLEDLKEEVTNYAALVRAEKRLAALKENLKQIELVQSLIEQIGPVSLSSEEAIVKARFEYMKIPTEMQDLVKNYQTLVLAEDALLQLQIKDKEEYEAVQNVKHLIDSIGLVHLEGTEIVGGERVQAARKAYDALPDNLKRIVPNYSALILSEDKLKELEVQRVIVLISEIGRITKEKETKIEAARKAYDKLSLEDQRKVSNYRVLEHAEKILARITGGEKESEERIAQSHEILERNMSAIQADYSTSIYSITKSSAGHLIRLLKDAEDAYRRLPKAEKELVHPETASLLDVYKRRVEKILHVDQRHGISVDRLDWFVELKTQRIGNQLTGFRSMEEKLEEKTLVTLYSMMLYNHVEPTAVYGERTVQLTLPLPENYVSGTVLQIVRETPDKQVSYLTPQIDEASKTMNVAVPVTYAEATLVGVVATNDSVLSVAGTAPLAGSLLTEQNVLIGEEPTSEVVVSSPEEKGNRKTSVEDRSEPEETVKPLTPDDVKDLNIPENDETLAEKREGIQGKEKDTAQEAEIFMAKSSTATPVIIGVLVVIFIGTGIVWNRKRSREEE